jgi:hypothetical protein
MKVKGVARCKVTMLQTFFKILNIFLTLITICGHEVVCGQEIGKYTVTMRIVCSAYE